MAKQLAVISGKGGTGKTTLVASFAALAKDAVLADCDVDAADLHLILSPEVNKTHDFTGGYSAAIDKEKCTECGICVEHCRWDAIDENFVIDPLLCEGCGVCFDVCPADAVTFEKEQAGLWFESTTRFGPMVHASLFAGQDNSGRLVEQVRKTAKETADRLDSSLIIVDGSPGIGCPVISTITGVDHVLVCAEPTPSGRHDLDRVLELAEQFKIPASVCINKSDIAPEASEQIVASVEKKGAEVLGLLPYDIAAVEAMVKGLSVIEAGDSPLARAISRVWSRLQALLVD